MPGIILVKQKQLFGELDTFQEKETLFGEERVPRLGDKRGYDDADCLVSNKKRRLEKTPLPRNRASENV